MKLPFVIIRRSTLDFYADMEYRFACVLECATNGRMSKTNYSKETMYAEIHDAFCRERDQAFEEGHEAGRGESKHLAEDGG